MSHTTVSLALRNDPALSAPTRQRLRPLADALGMRVECFWLGLDGVGEVSRVLRARPLRGSLIVPFPVPNYPRELDWPQVVCVALGYAFPTLPLHRATHHHFRGALVSVENLVRLGLMLEETENSRVGCAWLGGYLAGQMAPKNAKRVARRRGEREEIA